MKFGSACVIVNTIALFLIALTPKNETPVYGTPPFRLFGIFVVSHLVIAFVSGSMIGWLSSIRPKPWAMFLGIVAQFVIGQAIHMLFGVPTMLLFQLGFGLEPNGTGHLAEPVLQY
jgi:hypothetical protein